LPNLLYYVEEYHGLEKLTNGQSWVMAKLTLDELVVGKVELLLRVLIVDVLHVNQRVIYSKLNKGVLDVHSGVDPSRG
jgi:hypothetical protein